MTKLFCDLCGAPALEKWPGFSVDFPDEPLITARIVFEEHKTPNSISSFNPDLCGNCIANLLRKMADTIK